ncbi:MAG TPA: nuclear transport factor 2 family protein [Pyrinomonadaceae bacterium]|jgi:ketosteroid isomerase-like protein|nr:nuclear transport factor 2 family protein [Pyrinomonadaceae bacterium]
MSEQNKSIVNQAYNNFKTGNIDGLLNLMADDVTWTLPEMEGVPFAGIRTGRAGVGEFFATLAAVEDSLRFESRELVAEGDKVIALGSYDWRVKTTAREFSGDFAHVWTIRDGKVVAFQEYTDTAAVRDAHQKAVSASGEIYGA